MYICAISSHFFRRFHRQCAGLVYFYVCHCVWLPPLYWYIYETFFSFVFFKSMSFLCLAYRGSSQRIKKIGKINLELSAKLVGVCFLCRSIFSRRFQRLCVCVCECVKASANKMTYMHARTQTHKWIIERNDDPNKQTYYEDYMSFSS